MSIIDNDPGHEYTVGDAFRNDFQAVMMSDDASMPGDGGSTRSRRGSGHNRYEFVRQESETVTE